MFLRICIFAAQNQILIHYVWNSSRPSDEDIKLAYDPNASYMIMSLMAENPVINSFHIEGGQVTKEDLRIYSDEYYF